MNFLQLPVDVIEQILGYLTYDEIAKRRIVCKQLNEICQRLLNRGFMLIERRHSLSLKAIKAQLPRRESERRFHPFSRHCDILTSIETRLSMLSMTYSKFMDHAVCCFIPGRVLDEVRRVLALVEGGGALPRAHEVLQELRDISSMAIEHFDDKVAPSLRQKMLPLTAPVHTETDVMGDVRRQLQLLRGQHSRSRHTCLKLNHYYSKVLTKMKAYKKLVHNQRRALKVLNWKQYRMLHSMADMKKRIEECDVRYQELTHSQVSGGKGIKELGALSASGVGVGLKNFGSQIKLDPSLLIGAPNNREGPNIKPRKTRLPREPPAAMDCGSSSSSSSNSEEDQLAQDIASVTPVRFECRSKSWGAVNDFTRKPANTFTFKVAHTNTSPNTDTSTPSTSRDANTNANTPSTSRVADANTSQTEPETATKPNTKFDISQLLQQLEKIKEFFTKLINILQDTKQADAQVETDKSNNLQKLNECLKETVEEFPNLSRVFDRFETVDEILNVILEKKDDGETSLLTQRKRSLSLQDVDATSRKRLYNPSSK